MEYVQDMHLQITEIVDAEILNKCDTTNAIYSCDYNGVWYGIILYCEETGMWSFSPNGDKLFHKVFIDDISKFLNELHFKNKGKLN